MLRKIIFPLIVSLSAMTSAYAANLIGIAAATGDVYKINTSSPQTPQLIFSLGAGRDFAGLTFSPVSRTFFAYSRAENKIYEFNKSGTVLNVLTLDRALTPGFGGPRGITMDQQGRLYVVGFNNDVYNVNLVTGKTSLKFRASGATSEVEGLAMLDDQAFLGIGVRSQVLLITRGTGLTRTIATLPAGDLDAMTNTIEGWIYLSESGSGSQLHAFNPFTQTYQSLGWANIPHLSSLEQLPWNAK